MAIKTKGKAKAKARSDAPRRDVAGEITDRIIAALEAGTRPWAKGWSGGGSGLPVRCNGQPYQGINVILLWMAQAAGGFTSNLWMTLRQANAENGRIIKGSTSTEIVFAKSFATKDKTTGEESRAFVYKTYRVFNADQIEGLPEGREAAAPALPVTGAALDASLEGFYGALGMDLRHGGDRAFYSPLGDYVQMPPVAAFHTTGDYYGTLGHEAIHWTGGAGRLNRIALIPAARAEYAFEELVAEIGSCFLAAEIGGVPDLENSAAYVASWLTALKGDRKFVLKAASEASVAVGWALKRAGRVVEAEEDEPEDEAPVLAQAA